MNETKELHPTEVKAPKQVKGFRDVIEKLYQVHLDKNKDYSPANIVVMGEIGVLVRIWDKLCRLCNLYGISVPCVGPKIDNLIEDIEQKEMSNADILERLHTLKKESEFDFYNVQAQTAHNEPVEDAWLDMACYAIIGFLKRLNLWGR